MKPFWIFVCGAAFGFLIGKSESKNVFVMALCAILFALSFPADEQQAEAKVPPSPVRGEISLSNSEQQPLPNQHNYKFGTQLTHDLSRVAVLATRRQDFKGRQAC
jgi:hypothetical protein